MYMSDHNPRADSYHCTSVSRAEVWRGEFTNMRSSTLPVTGLRTDSAES